MGHWRTAAAATGLPPSTLTVRSDDRSMGRISMAGNGTCGLQVEARRLVMVRQTKTLRQKFG